MSNDVSSARRQKSLRLYGRELSSHARTNARLLAEPACRMCGATEGEPDPFAPGRPLRLRISYLIPPTAGGTDDGENLDITCSLCHAGRAGLGLTPPSARELLRDIRRASGQDQAAVLAWLVQRYPERARALVTAGQ